MADLVSHNELVAGRTACMRALSDTDRADAIAASPNVIGFGRFKTVGDGGTQVIRAGMFEERAPCSDGTDGA